MPMCNENTVKVEFAVLLEVLGEILQEERVSLREISRVDNRPFVTPADHEAVSSFQRLWTRVIDWEVDYVICDFLPFDWVR